MKGKQWYLKIFYFILILIKILPVENKLENPEDFLYNFGVLPTTMILCTVFMTAIGLYGYNSFGEDVI